MPPSGAGDYVREEDTPVHFDVSYDDEGCAQRELTDFVVAVGDEKISICSLDDLHACPGEVIARGKVTAKGKSLRVVTAPLIEWCIEYAQTPNLWVRSAKVWYRLQKPAREYVKTHELARSRFEICSRIYILGTSMHPDEAKFKAFAQLLANPYMDMRGYSERDILTQKDFILAQIKNLDSPALNAISFVQELKSRKSGSGSTRKGASTAAKKMAVAPPSAGGAANAPGSLWVPHRDLDESGEARLLKKAEKAVVSVSKNKNAFPFREPVNPQVHGCPDYLDRIKHPMDYGTIRARLEKGEYTTALEVAKDMRLVASNCREYNGDDHEYSKWAIELGKKFENTMRTAEEAERASMSKRLNSAAGKKRRAAELNGSSHSAGAKGAPAKAARKAGKKPAEEVSTPVPSVSAAGTATPTPSSAGAHSPSSSSKERAPGGDILACVRNIPDPCGKNALEGSKYCSDECGLMVARQRIDEMLKAGIDVAEFIRATTTKLLVQTRGIGV